MVVNKRHHKPTANDVYIGRPSKWGNPFVIGKHGDRNEVVRKYAEMVANNPKLMADVRELKGKTLVCWCKPELCHGDFLEALCEAV